jgi:hypothetical protein
VENLSVPALTAISIQSHGKREDDFVALARCKEKIN